MGGLTPFGDRDVRRAFYTEMNRAIAEATEVDKFGPVPFGGKDWDWHYAIYILRCLELKYRDNELGTFQMGQRAFGYGKPEDANPFAEEGDFWRWHRWRCGWLAAEREKEHGMAYGGRRAVAVGR